MTTSTRPFDLPTPTDSGTTRTWAYSVTSPISPTSSDYQGPAFYGALMTGHTNGPVNFGQTAVVDTPSGGRIAISLLGSGENTARIQGLIFFKKEDFVNMGSATFTFDNSSKASIGWGFFGGSGGVRAAAMVGSTWYLSQSLGSGSNGSLTINDLAAENFAAWNPAGAPLNATPDTFDVAGSVFTDIQALGYYFDLERTGNQAQVWVRDIEFSAIPEPRLSAFLLALAALIGVFRRRLA